MIIAARRRDESYFSGFNICLIRDWVQPVEHLCLEAFNYFDEALMRVKSDEDATRIYVPEERENQFLTALNTASSAALRALPERFRNGVELYTVAVESRLDQAPTVWFQIPAWASLFVEDRDGGLDLISSESRPQNRKWAKADSLEKDLFIHLSLLSAFPNCSLSRGQEILVFRASSLIQASREQEAGPTLSLRLYKNLEPLSEESRSLGDFS